MNITTYNKDNLTDDQIDQVVTRVKVFVLNYDNQMLLASSGGGCQLPGGHVEHGEALVPAVIREVREETGISLTKQQVPKPFYEVRHYTKNYKNSNKNRLSKIIYYFVKTDLQPNMQLIELTENEKKNDFSIAYVDKSEFEKIIIDVKNNNPSPLNRTIAEEMLEAYAWLQVHMASTQK